MGDPKANSYKLLINKFDLLKFNLFKDWDFFYAESIKIIEVRNMPGKRPEIYKCGNILPLIGKNLVISPELL